MDQQTLIARMIATFLHWEQRQVSHPSPSHNFAEAALGRLAWLQAEKEVGDARASDSVAGF